MIPGPALLPPSVQMVVIACAALVASLVPLSILLWPKRDEPATDESVRVRSKGELP
jgi:hypothetical protein